MARALVVTVHLLGEAYNGTGDWPPAPARLFQALVAGAAKGRHLDATDRVALLWLEALSPPRIAAPAAVRVPTPTLFVPNNDLDAKGGDPARVAELRVAKRTEQRRLEAPAPILYVYAPPTEPPPGVAALVERLYRLGRGDDPAFASAEFVDPEKADARLAGHPGVLRVPAGGGTIPVPVPGTLESLEERFAKTLSRFQIEGHGKRAKTVFVQPPKALFGRIGYDTPPRRFAFDILGESRFAPVPLDRAGILVDGLRKAAACRLAAEGIELAERLVVGRDATAEDLVRRVRVLPIPSVGHAETDPSIRRVEVYVPAGCPIDPADIAWSFRGLEPCDPDTGEVIAEGMLVTSTDRAMGERFDGPARRWRSITPLALAARRRRIPPEAVRGNEKAGAERQSEEDAAVARVAAALGQASVRGQARAVRVRREPFGKREAMAEAFASGTRFAKHTLWHAEITFDRAVAGPLVLGDGRFTGLGLMRPVPEVAGAFALHADRPLSDAPETLGAALRRAVMAAARDATGSPTLAPFFTGHAEGGAPLREGGRRHIATLGDPPRRRFLVLAPHLLDRREVARDERRPLRELDAAVARLTRLVAGRHGVFSLTAEVVEPDDALFSPSAVWESLTPYVMTRHPKSAASEAVGDDVAAECRRRALPVPTVEVLAEERGLRFRLRLGFRRPVAGPVCLGRTTARGGLFVPVPDR